MAAKQVSEQEIQFRKRARRRLVGAVALVLLMVTVLPMVLDDREAKTPQPDIAISIPSQDGGDFSSRIVPVAPQAAGLKPSPAPVQLASPLESKPVESKPVESKPAIAKPVVSELAKPEPVAKPQPAVPSATESKVPALKAPEAKTSEAKPAETRPVEAKPAAKPMAEEASAKPAAVPVPKPKPAVADKGAAKKGGFSVQIGVFTESDQFKQLESKVLSQGFHPSREKLDTPKGPKIRLRIGPFTTRADAEKALGKLKSADLPGMIVTNK